jgi:TRAP-type C4-dicarboxylate transport system permease large subunit
MSGRDANYVALASLPFFFLMLVAIGAVVAFPQIAVWLPDALLGATRK